MTTRRTIKPGASADRIQQGLSYDTFFSGGRLAIPGGVTAFIPEEQYFSADRGTWTSATHPDRQFGPYAGAEDHTNLTIGFDGSIPYVDHNGETGEGKDGWVADASTWIDWTDSYMIAGMFRIDKGHPTYDYSTNDRALLYSTSGPQSMYPYVSPGSNPAWKMRNQTTSKEVPCLYRTTSGANQYVDDETSWNWFCGDVDGANDTAHIWVNGFGQAYNFNGTTYGDGEATGVVNAAPGGNLRLLPFNLPILLGPLFFIDTSFSDAANGLYANRLQEFLEAMRNSALNPDVTWS